MISEKGRDSLKKLKGVIVATVTPMTEEGLVDYDAVISLTHFLIDKKVHGLFPCGSTGEGILLSTEERKKIAKLSVDETAGRVPVVIHTGSMNMAEAVELTSHAQEIGADGAALIPPYYYSIDEKALLDYYRTVAKQVPDFPLYIYNIPGNVKNVITPKEVAQLSAEFPNIVGIKDSSMDFMNFINFKQKLGEGFCILMGNDAQIYSSLLMGGSGAIAATACVFPEKVVEIYEAIAAGDLERALKAQDVVTKIRAIFRSYPPVASYKKALEYRGIKGGVPRRPLRPLTEEETQKLIAEFKVLNLL